MVQEKEWVGLDVSGEIVGQDGINCNSSIAVAEGKSILGEEFRLPDGGCTCNYPSINLLPGDREFDIVVGDPRLIRQVKLIVRGIQGELKNIPDIVKKAFPREEILIFEDRKGNHLYIMLEWATLYDPEKFGALESSS